jgi:hypothetical protein
MMNNKKNKSRKECFCFLLVLVWLLKLKRYDRPCDAVYHSP